MTESELTIMKRELEEHIENTELQFGTERRKFDKLEQCVVQGNDEMKKKMDDLNKNVEKLTDNTSGIVQTYEDLQGLARIGITAQKVGMWLVKWPLIGTGAYQILKWINNHIN